MECAQCGVIVHVVNVDGLCEDCEGAKLWEEDR